MIVATTNVTLTHGEVKALNTALVFLVGIDKDVGFADRQVRQQFMTRLKGVIRDMDGKPDNLVWRCTDISLRTKQQIVLAIDTIAQVSPAIAPLRKKFA